VGELPTGTVTFLFTDVEGSTRLWEENPEAMKKALSRHDEIVRGAIERNQGVVFSTMGDGMAAVFVSAPAALRATLEAQQELAVEAWRETGPLLVRMGLHSDEGRLRAPGEYVNRPLNRCARLMGVAHGGQVLVSDATAAVARDNLPAGVRLLDLGPHQLRDVAGPIRVFQLVQPDLPNEFPPLRTLDELPGNLPRQLTTFVGREPEIESLAHLVRDRPFVTVTGVGGVGKSRLAVQVAAEVAADFPDGAWLCELAPLTGAEALWAALAATLGVRPFPGRDFDESVLEYLRTKRLMLVLDNCEHLLDAAAEAVYAITRRCPQVALLATSREGLAVAGERVVAVAPLRVPARGADLDALLQNDAVHLFLDRARDAKSDFTITEENYKAIAQLCRRLDGIPLAIELAAARVRSLAPEDLVARLDERFKLLTRGSRAATERQQTLRNTIDWSYDLLSATEADALNRLSVFSGDCDLRAAESVLPSETLDRVDVPEVLCQLVDKSLIVVEDDASGMRYRLLETIRQYARERLEASGDASEPRRRHADYFVEIAESAGPRLRSSDQLDSAAWVARETDNFRAALDWAAETSSPDHALRLVAPLAVHSMTIGYSAMGWAETATNILDADRHRLFPAVLAWAAWGATMRGELERAAVLIARADEAQHDLNTTHLGVVMARATLAFFRGDLEQAEESAERWLDLARATEDPYEIAHALVMVGAASQFSDPGRAVGALSEAVDVARGSGIASALSIGLSTLAGLLPLEESDRAVSLFDEAIAVGTAIGDRQGVSNAAQGIGWIAARRGDWRAALRASVDAAAQKLALGDLSTFACDLAAVSLAALGYQEPAAVLLGVARATADRFGPDWFMEIAASTDAHLLEGLGERQVAALGSRGAAFDPADALAYLRAEADRALGTDGDR
jgi:predicted ATPase/class 3 adenylate cyclase